MIKLYAEIHSFIDKFQNKCANLCISEINNLKNEQYNVFVDKFVKKKCEIQTFINKCINLQII